MSFFSNLFGKQKCSFCGNEVSVLKRDSLINKEGYICKECLRKCSCLIKPGKFTKEELDNHIKYMEKQNELFEKAFEPAEKTRFMCVETGIEFADSLAMFTYISRESKKKIYKELFRYDQIKDYEPYMINNTAQDGKKYKEVGVKIKLNCYFDPSDKQFENNRSYHPYVYELIIPRHKNVDEFSNDPMLNYLDKLFGRYEDTSLVGSIKSSLAGTNKKRQQTKVAVEGIKTLGSLAKTKITNKEEDKEKLENNLDKFKNDSMNLISGNRSTYTKIANEVEDKIINK